MQRREIKKRAGCSPFAESGPGKGEVGTKKGSCAPRIRTETDLHLAEKKGPWDGFFLRNGKIKREGGTPAGMTRLSKGGGPFGNLSSRIFWGGEKGGTFFAGAKKEP